MDYPVYIEDGVLSVPELSHLHKVFKSIEWDTPEKTSVATDEEGNFKRQGGSKVLQEDWSPDTPQSNYPLIRRDLFNSLNKLTEEAEKNKIWFWRNIPNTANIAVLAGKYSVGDYYSKHRDDSRVTAILFLSWGGRVRGGDLILEGNRRIGFKSNRLVVFPSVIEHEVEEVTGSITRYSLTFFLN